MSNGKTKWKHQIVLHSMKLSRHLCSNQLKKYHSKEKYSFSERGEENHQEMIQTFKFLSFLNAVRMTTYVTSYMNKVC